MGGGKVAPKKDEQSDLPKRKRTSAKMFSSSFNPTQMTSFVDNVNASELLSSFHTNEQRNLYHVAARQFNTVLLDKIAQKHSKDGRKKLARGRDYYGNTPIILACIDRAKNKSGEENQKKCIEKLLKDCRGSIDQFGYNKSSKTSCLHWLATHGTWTAFEQMVKVGREDKNKDTALDRIRKEKYSDGFARLLWKDNSLGHVVLDVVGSLYFRKMLELEFRKNTTDKFIDADTLLYSREVLPKSYYFASVEDYENIAIQTLECTKSLMESHESSGKKAGKIFKLEHLKKLVFWATFFGKFDVVQLALMYAQSRKIDISSLYKWKHAVMRQQNAFHAAATMGRNEAFKEEFFDEFFKKDDDKSKKKIWSNMMKRDFEGNTPLHIAYVMENFDERFGGTKKTIKAIEKCLESIGLAKMEYEKSIRANKYGVTIQDYQNRGSIKKGNYDNFLTFEYDLSAEDKPFFSCCSSKKSAVKSVWKENTKVKLENILLAHGISCRQIYANDDGTKVIMKVGVLRGSEKFDEWAEEMNYHCEYIFSDDRVPFRKDLLTMFQPWNSRDKIKILLNHITERDKGVNIESYFTILTRVTVLHNSKEIKTLKKMWFKWTPKWATLHECFFENQHNQFSLFTTITYYFGEELGFYFSFLYCYNLFLIFIALPGMVVGAIQLYSIVDAGDLNAGIFDATNAIYFSVYLSIWATLFVEYWKRKSSEIKTVWGLNDGIVSPGADLEGNRVRKGFFGNERVDPISGDTVKYFPSSKRWMRTSLQIPILLVLGAGIIAGFLVLQSWNEMSKGMPVYISMIGGILNGLSIIILNRAYSILARQVCDFENHRTDASFQQSLTVKVFLFQLINGNVALFHTAFVQRNRIKLYTLLFTIMVSKQVVNTVKQIVLPAMKYKSKDWCGSSKDRVEDSVLPTTKEKEHKRNISYLRENNIRGRYDGILDDYAELIQQFSYLINFSAAFPLAPVISLIVNIVQSYGEMNLYLNYIERPTPKVVDSIGKSWVRVLEFLALLAVVCNFALIYFTLSDSNTVSTSPNAIHLDPFNLVLLEHAMIGIKICLAVFISDTPSWVKKKLKQAKFKSHSKQKKEDSIKQDRRPSTPSPRGDNKQPAPPKCTPPKKSSARESLTITDRSNFAEDGVDALNYAQLSTKVSSGFQKKKKKRKDII